MEALSFSELAPEIGFERFGGGEARLTKLVAESVSDEDIRRIVEICNQDKVNRWVTRQHATGENGEYLTEDARQFVEFANEGWTTNSSFMYLIRDENNRVMGTIDIKSNNKDRAEIGYWTDTLEDQGGYMTNAVLALSGSAKQAGFRRLYGFVEPHNDASRAVLERAGFVEDEVVRMEMAGEEREFLRVVKQLD